MKTPHKKYTLISAFGAIIVALCWFILQIMTAERLKTYSHDVWYTPYFKQMNFSNTTDNVHRQNYREIYKNFVNAKEKNKSDIACNNMNGRPSPEPVCLTYFKTSKGIEAEVLYYPTARNIDHSSLSIFRFVHSDVIMNYDDLPEQYFQALKDNNIRPTQRHKESLFYNGGTFRFQVETLGDDVFFIPISGHENLSSPQQKFLLNNF